MEEGEVQTTYGNLMGQDYRPSKSRIFLSRNSSSCATEQFHSDVSLETVDRRVPYTLKKYQWTMESDAARDDRHLLRMKVNDRTASFG